MKWSPSLYILGSFLILIGLILLLFPNWGTREGFFFIFPFFVFGGTQSFNTVLLLGIGMLLFVVMFCLMISLTTRSNSELSQKTEFMSVGSYCEFCGSPMPVNATYCPSCGQPVDYHRQAKDEY